jgi:hypothetical protein
MALKTFKLSTAWSLVVTSTVEDFSIKWDENIPIAFTMTEAGDANTPVIIGVMVDGGDIPTRESLGAGNVWARLVNSVNTGFINLRVSTDEVASVLNLANNSGSWSLAKEMEKALLNRRISPTISASRSLKHRMMIRNTTSVRLRERNNAYIYIHLS